jgi:hypothetical protein
MTAEQIKSISADTYSEEWQPVIDFFRDRYQKRYFAPIQELQTHKSFDIRNNCGFLIASIDCILIETLEQYYEGTDETEKSTQDAFLNFFSRSVAFRKVIKDQKDVGLFAGLMRSGLLHQSKTKKSSIINIKSETPILGWIDEGNKRLGFQLHRDKFHQAVIDEYDVLVEEIKKEDNKILRRKFLDKILSLVE